MFQPAPLRDPRRRRIQEHQRTEDYLFARAAADQMEQKRKCDRCRTGQEQWRKKTQNLNSRAVSSRSVTATYGGFKLLLVNFLRRRKQRTRTKTTHRKREHGRETKHRPARILIQKLYFPGKSGQRRRET